MTRNPPLSVIRMVSFLLALYAFWLLLSGMFTPFLLLSGIGSAIAILLISRRMDVVDHEGHPIQLGWRPFLSYWPWLLKEIWLAGWDVTKRILSPALPISPTITEFVPTQRTDLGLVIHANSITLTPGTISLEVEAGRFLVHALTREGAAALAGSEMDRRCTALERT